MASRLLSDFKASSTFFLPKDTTGRAALAGTALTELARVAEGEVEAEALEAKGDTGFAAGAGGGVEAGEEVSLRREAMVGLSADVPTAGDSVPAGAEGVGACSPAAASCARLAARSVEIFFPAKGLVLLEGFASAALPASPSARTHLRLTRCERSLSDKVQDCLPLSSDVPKKPERHVCEAARGGALRHRSIVESESALVCKRSDGPDEVSNAR